jgi:alpha-D-xyloside xylohydrolase
MFRSHGTDAAREAWRFGEPGNPFHDAIVAHIRLRYQLIHYIYSAAHEATTGGMPMISPLGLAFPDDLRAHGIDDQFLCGRSLLVCPVTRPMYYDAGSRPLTDVARTRSVYLPEGSSWCDYHTGALYAGGRTLEVEAPLERIPLFVRAGSIIPLAAVAPTTEAAAAGPVTLHIYPGADGHAIWYEDAGDGNDHEAGAYALTPLSWDQNTATLRIGRREGTYPGMPRNRLIALCLHKPEGLIEAQIEYTGEALSWGSDC